jgi:hypothetical protein
MREKRVNKRIRGENKIVFIKIRDLRLKNPKKTNYGYKITNFILSTVCNLFYNIINESNIFLKPTKSEVAGRHGKWL